jgi:hypothetical protein
MATNRECFDTRQSRLSKTFDASVYREAEFFFGLLVFDFVVSLWLIAHSSRLNMLFDNRIPLAGNGNAVWPRQRSRVKSEIPRAQIPYS